MGSQADDARQLTVLVTGFGPFREQFPVNPSWEIARGLPSHLPPLRAKDPRTPSAVVTPPVRILVHPEAIRVNYQIVRALVPSFWEPYPQDDEEAKGRIAIDMIVHIGMAGVRPVYQIERTAHARGFVAPDVDGKRPPETVSGDYGTEWCWHGLPDELKTELDMPDILERWQVHSPKDLALAISDNAGRYLCEFIYFSSLAHLFKAGRPRRVLFLHVPADSSDVAVARGRGLVVNLIRAMVESETCRQTPAPAVDAQVPL